MNIESSTIREILVIQKNTTAIKSPLDLRQNAMTMAISRP